MNTQASLFLKHGGAVPAFTGVRFSVENKTTIS